MSNENNKKQAEFLWWTKYRLRIIILVILNFPKAKKLFKHPYLSSLILIFGKFPWTIEYKDGHTFQSYDPWKFYDIRSKNNYQFEFYFNGKKVMIKNAERGDVEGVFNARSYEWLPVKDKIVIDVGANIGDTAIFFALKGAKHVYAFEIVPSTFQLAKENISLNNLDDKITVLNEGLGKEGTIRIPHDIIADGGFSTSTTMLKENVDGVEVRIKSLNKVVNELGIENAVMKIDCEGCEYDVINKENMDSLRKFSHIMGEYHYGYDKLKEVLEEAGFEFSATKPAPFYAYFNKNPYTYTGIFKAVKKL